MLFCDVSFWQGVINWDRAKSSGLSGAILKASEAKFVDPKFSLNSASCSLEYKGAYHFLREGNGADQCKFFLDTIGDFGNLRGALDFEIVPSSANMTTALDWVNEYLKEVGVPPVLYLNTSLSQTKQWTTLGYKYLFRNFTSYPLWIANYNPVSSPGIGAWENYALWQYTRKATGSLYGVQSASIDLNRVNNLGALLLNKEDDESLTDSEKLAKLWAWYESRPDLH